MLDSEFSNFENWSIIIQVVGLLLVVISVGFVAYQTRQVAKQEAFNVRESEYSRMAAIDEIFVRDPDMYPFFYDDKPIASSDPKFPAVLSVAMAMTNYLEATLPKDGSELRGHMAVYLVDQYKISPVLREYLRTRKDWFDPRLVKAMERATVDLSSPPVATAPAPTVVKLS